MKRKLLLSGGAAKGAVQLYSLQQLMARHNYYEIEGVSIGAVNGVMAAQNKLTELKMIWDKVDGRRSFMTFKWWWPFQGIYHLGPLRSQISHYVSLRDIQTPFKAGIVSLNNGEYYALSTNEMLVDSDLHDAVQASATVIGVMEPIEMEVRGERHLVADGGFRNIIPTPVEVEPDITDVDVVLCSPINRVHALTKVSDISEHIMRALDIMQEEILQRDLNELRQGYPNARITVYAPQRDPLPSFKADRATIQYRYEIGREAWRNPLLFQDP